jgi:hypothetical protein
VESGCGEMFSFALDGGFDPTNEPASIYEGPAARRRLLEQRTSVT